MPYISLDRKLDADLAVLVASMRNTIRRKCTPGDLNYFITQLLIAYLDGKGMSYTHINDCMGALSGASQEFYRRVAVPFEDGKALDNGDVYFSLLKSYR